MSGTALAGTKRLYYEQTGLRDRRSVVEATGNFKNEECTMNAPQEPSPLPCDATCGARADLPDDPVRLCHDCQAGCTSRRTQDSTDEEINAGPYLIFSAIVIVLASLAIRWLL